MAATLSKAEKRKPNIFRRHRKTHLNNHVPLDVLHIDKKRDSILSHARKSSNTNSRINADISDMVHHTKYPRPRPVKLKTHGSQLEKRVFKIYNVPPENISTNRVLNINNKLDKTRTLRTNNT